MNWINEEKKRLKQLHKARLIGYVVSILCLAFAFYIAYILIYTCFPENENLPVGNNGQSSVVQSATADISGNAPKVNIGLVHVKLFKELIPNVLFALLGAAIAIIISTFWMDKEHEKTIAVEAFAMGDKYRVLDDFCKKLAVTFNGGILESFNEGHHYLESLKNSMLNAPKGRIILVDSWLCTDIPKVVANLEVTILDALNKGSEVIFILMHPNSPLVDRREDVLGRPAIKTQIKVSADELHKIYCAWIKNCRGDRTEEEWINQTVNAKQKMDQFKVYLADTYLSLQLYSIPGVSYCGFYVAGFTSTHGPHISALTGSDLGNMMQKYAEHLFNMCAEGDKGMGVRVRFRESDEFEGVNIKNVLDHLVGRQLKDLIGNLKIVSGRIVPPRGLIDEEWLSERDLESLRLAIAVMRLSADERAILNRGSSRVLMGKKLSKMRDSVPSL